MSRTRESQTLARGNLDGPVPMMTESEARACVNDPDETHPEVLRRFRRLLDDLLRDPIKAVLMAKLFRAVEEEPALATEYAELFEQFAGNPLRRQSEKAPIPSALRWAVWQRDDFTCQYCARRNDLSLDHVIPESQGGPTTFDNLVTACGDCNRRKGVGNAREFADSMAFVWSSNYMFGLDL